MIPANAICVATPVSPPSWIAQSLLPTNDGFLRVDQMLCGTRHTNPYAAGDIVSLETPRSLRSDGSKIGEYLAKAIWTKLNGHTPKAFTPKKLANAIESW